MPRRPSSTPPPSTAAIDSPVTLEQVASRAGVSPSTVSRILTGNARVSADKKSAVEAAIRELGYRPNPVARGLAGGRTMSVGVVTQAISSPYYGESLMGVEYELQRDGYAPLIVSGHWNERSERRAIETLLARRVDGLIVFAGRLSSGELGAVAQRLPMVVTGRQLVGPQLYSLVFHDRLGARLATEHLIQLGHARIAMLVGDLRHDDAIERRSGYLDALQAAGITPDPQLMVSGDYSEAGGLQAMQTLLERGLPFSALFSANDQMAFGAILALRRRGLRVPDDVSVVGFDDIAMSRYISPPLTTVRQSIYEQGQLAARALLSLLRGDVAQATLPEPELVHRESTRRLLR